jgi:hypothetical protein
MPPEERTHTPNSIEVPAPTPWAFVTAFGLALLAAGIVTSLAVSVVGLVVILFGAVEELRTFNLVRKVIASTFPSRFIPTPPV